MTQPASKFRKTLISSAIGLALVTSAPDVMATVITAQVDYDVGGITSQSDTDTSAVEPSNVDVIGGNGDPGGSVFYHTFGDTDGSFGSRVSGNGNFDITGYFEFENTYTNSTGISQDYIFDFTIIAGNLGHDFFGLTAGDSLFSSYDIDVMVDLDQDGTFESTVFESFASISTDDTGTTSLVEAGTQLDGATYNTGSTFASYSWNETLESLFITSLAAGDSFDFRYILTTTASGVSSVSNNDCFEGEIDGPEGGSCNSAISRSGDPFGPGPNNAFSVSSTPTPTNDVPEPAGLAFLGFGVTAWIAGRRRKNK